MALISLPRTPTLSTRGRPEGAVKDACRHSTVVVSQIHVDLAQTALALEIDAAFPDEGASSGEVV